MEIDDAVIDVERDIALLTAQRTGLRLNEVIRRAYTTTTNTVFAEKLIRQGFWIRRPFHSPVEHNWRIIATVTSLCSAGQFFAIVNGE